MLSHVLTILGTAFVVAVALSLSLLFLVRLLRNEGFQQFCSDNWWRIRYHPNFTRSPFTKQEIGRAFYYGMDGYLFRRHILLRTRTETRGDMYFWVSQCGCCREFARRAYFDIAHGDLLVVRAHHSEGLHIYPGDEGGTVYRKRLNDRVVASLLREDGNWES